MNPALNTHEDRGVHQPGGERSALRTKSRRCARVAFAVAVLPGLRAVGAAIARPLRTICGLDHGAATREVLALLERVQLRPELADRYPRELSGGERQRVAIARALAARPDLLICDEITSSLDTSVQASILDLLDDLRSPLRLALLLITHDFGVLARIADRVLVLDHGAICEQGPVTDVLASPAHELTRHLLTACRSLGNELDQRRFGQQAALGKNG